MSPPKKNAAATHRYATRSRSPPKTSAKTALAFDNTTTEAPSSASTAHIEALIFHLNTLEPPTHEGIDALWAQMPAFDVPIHLPNRVQMPDVVQRISVFLERLSSRLALEYPPPVGRDPYSPGFPPSSDDDG